VVKCHGSCVNICAGMRWIDHARPCAESYPCGYRHRYWLTTPDEENASDSHACPTNSLPCRVDHQGSPRALERRVAKAMLDHCGGVSVWRVVRLDKVEVDAELHGQFFDGDCYLVLHEWRLVGTTEAIIYHWQGSGSSPSDRRVGDALRLDSMLNAWGVVQHWYGFPWDWSLRRSSCYSAGELLSTEGLQALPVLRRSFPGCIEYVGFMRAACFPCKWSALQQASALILHISCSQREDSHWSGVAQISAKRMPSVLSWQFAYCLLRTTVMWK